MKKDYWTIVLDDIYPEITFKFKQVNPIDMINLITESMDYEKANSENKKTFVNKCLSYVLFSKNNVDYLPIVDFEGNPHLPELLTNPEIGLDLFFEFRKQVILPVFFESKTYQNLIQDKKKTSSQK